MTDFTLIDCGSIMLLRPWNDSARSWIHEYVGAEPWQWFGACLAIERRYVATLVAGFLGDGFTMENYS